MIATTARDAHTAEGKDISDCLDLPEGERDFIDAMLLEDVSIPLAVIGRRSGERTAVLILRSTVFETSMCLAFEFTSRAAQLFYRLYGRELDGVAASPLSRELVGNIGDADDAEADFLPPHA